MTKLEALEKIRKLPKLKKEFNYGVGDDGDVIIVNRHLPKEYTVEITTLFYDFDYFVKEIFYYDISSYKEYFETPIYKNGEIMGYE